LKKKNPSIICLQEVELSTMVDDFSSLLEEYNYVSHTQDKKRNNPIGNMTLYKKELSLIETRKNSSCIITIFDNFCIVNVHLRAGLKSKVDERINQMLSTFKLLSNVDLPKIIIGDYNDDLDADGKLYNLFHANGYVQNSNTWTYYAMGKFSSFDHIMSKDMKVLTFKKKKKEKKKVKREPIPNKKIPSDHHYIQCSFSNS
jgi:mRNA deadenylase 3'-5' endonuclease subunit Ccr4